MRSIKKIVGVTLFLFLYSAVLLASGARIEINVGFTDEENRKRIPKEITLHNGLEIVISGYEEVSNLHVELNHSKVDGIEANGKVVITLFNARQKEEVDPGQGEYHASLPFWLSVDYFGKDSPLEPIELGKVSPFYDALQLSKAAEDFIKQEILSKYFKEEEIFDMDPDALNERIKKIRERKEIPIEKIKVRKIEEEITAAKREGVPAPTMVIEAIAAFMVKRFKEELNIAFFDKFKKTLEKLEELRELFPRTTSFLLENEPYNYRWYLHTLKELFLEDLKNFTVGIRDCLQLIKDKNEIDPGDEDSYYAVMVSLELIDSMKKGMHPADAIERLHEANFLSEEETSVFVNSVKSLTLISRNIMDTTSEGWLKQAELKILVSKPDEIGKLFMGLIYNREKTRVKEIKFNNTPLEELIGDRLEEFFQILLRISQQGKIIQEHLQDIKEKKAQGEKIDFMDYYAYLGTAVDIIELSIDIIEFAGEVNDKQKEKFDTYIFIMREALEISKNIHEKSYAAALTNLLDILKRIMPDSIERGGFASSLIEAIIKYGTFMVAMINAKTSDDMESVLENAALPVGGYRIKRTRPFSITLNSYAGFFVSCERLADISPDDPMAGIGVNMESVEKNNVNLAFTAPVGVGFNFGSEKCRMSHSLFFPVIDIGAVVSFRLGSQEGLPELTWENVLAPGFFYILGLKNNPISIGLGIQYGPQLRKFTVTEESGAEAVLRAKAFRVGASVVVDIPIFHFY